MLVELRKSLESLLNQRVQQNDWIDTEKEKGLMKKLEAISCFGVPACSFEKLRLYDKDFEITKIPENIIREDLESIISRIDMCGYAPSPYLDDDFTKNNITYEKYKTDFIDTLSFFASGMLDLMEYYSIVFKKEIPFYKEVNIKFKESVNLLIEYAVQNNNHAYWTWGNKKYTEQTPSVYFTWSAVVSLSYVVQSEYASLSEAEKKTIKELLAKVVNWLSNIVKEDTDYPGVRMEVDYSRLDNVFSGRNSSLLIYIASMLDWLNQIAIEIPKELSKNIITTLIDIYRSNQLWKLEGGTHLILISRENEVSRKALMIEYEDRAIDYLLLSSLSWYFMLYNEKKIILEENLVQDLEAYIENLRKRVLVDRDPSNNLWKADGFLLYQTQRAIESISTYIRYVYPYETGTGLSLSDAIRLSVESVLEDIKPTLIDSISKNIELLKKNINGSR